MSGAEGGRLELAFRFCSNFLFITSCTGIFSNLLSSQEIISRYINALVTKRLFCSDFQLHQQLFQLRPDVAHRYVKRTADEFKDLLFYHTQVLHLRHKTVHRFYQMVQDILVAQFIVGYQVEQPAIALQIRAQVQPSS